VRLSRSRSQAPANAHAQLVSVADCLGLAAYQSQTGKLGKRDSTWHC
jgi:hypothetical protein